MKYFVRLLAIIACVQGLNVSAESPRIEVDKDLRIYKMGPAKPGSSKPAASYATPDSIRFEFWYKEDKSDKSKFKGTDNVVLVRLGNNEGWNEKGITTRGWETEDGWISLAVGDRLYSSKPITRFAFALNRKPMSADEINEYSFSDDRKNTFVQLSLADSGFDFSPQTGETLRRGLGRFFKKLPQKTVSGLIFGPEISTGRDDIIKIDAVDSVLYSKEQKGKLADEDDLEKLQRLDKEYAQLVEDSEIRKEKKEQKYIDPRQAEKIQQQFAWVRDKEAMAKLLGEAPEYTEPVERVVEQKNPEKSIQDRFYDAFEASAWKKNGEVEKMSVDDYYAQRSMDDDKIKIYSKSVDTPIKEFDFTATIAFSQDGTKLFVKDEDDIQEIDLDELVQKTQEKYEAQKGFMSIFSKKRQN